MGYTVGQKVSLGTLQVNGNYYAKPSNPKRTDEGGNLINYNGTNISIENTQSGKALQFIYVEDNGKKMLVCDRNLVAKVTWDNLNSAGLIFGKNVTIDGKKYKIRSLTGGVDSNDKNNEWSRIIEQDIYNIGNENNNWHWKDCYTWCQETYSQNSARRVLRGYSSASTWGNRTHTHSDNYCAFRPVLEILNSAPLISDTDKNLGDFVSPVQKDYTVSDAENNKFTVKEMLDGQVLRTLTNQSGGNYSISLSDRWLYLQNGVHTIKVIATDTEGETSIRTWTFNKTNTPPRKPIISSPVQGARTSNEFFVEFTVQTDPENNAQNFAVEIASNQEFTEDKQVFTNGLMKKNGSSWTAINTVTNADAGATFRIPVSNITDSKRKYLRVSTIDPDGSNTKNYSNIQEFLIGDTLLFETQPFNVDYLPKAVKVHLDGIIDNKATVLVEICNNANDDNKAWENATNSYSLGHAHIFENKVKTAESYAVATRVKIKSNDATGEISVKAVGLGVM